MRIARLEEVVGLTPAVGLGHESDFAVGTLVAPGDAAGGRAAGAAGDLETTVAVPQAKYCPGEIPPSSGFVCELIPVILLHGVFSGDGVFTQSTATPPGVTGKAANSCRCAFSSSSKRAAALVPLINWSSPGSTGELLSPVSVAELKDGRGG